MEIYVSSSLVIATILSCNENYDAYVCW